MELKDKLLREKRTSEFFLISRRQPKTYQHMGKIPLNIGEEVARTRIRKFCDYRERNHREVRDKLYSFGLYPGQVENMLSELVQENILNEERYASAFARGKFRTRHWGKVKITYELRQQQVSAYCIKKALKELDEEEYLSVLKKLAADKHEVLRKEKNAAIKKQKLYRYLLQKGYESQHIQKIITQLI
jgi:regulatory protein